MSTVAAAAVERGLPVVCVDPKGSVVACSRRCGRWRSGAVRMEPRGAGDLQPVRPRRPTEIADKALAGESWSEPHYLRQAQRVPGLGDKGVAGGRGRGSARFARLADGSRPAWDVGSRCGRTAQQLDRYLNSLATRQRQDLGGVRDRLAILAESQFGGYLDPTSGGRDRSRRVANRGSGLLPSRRRPLSVGLADARRGDRGGPRRADRRATADRAAGPGRDRRVRGGWRESDPADAVALAFRGHQRRRRDPGLADLEDVAGTDGGNFAARVLSQVDFTVAHRQPDPAAAERLSKLCGTRVVWSVNERVRSPLRDPFQAREGMRTFMSSFGTQASSSASALARRS